MSLRLSTEFRPAKLEDVKINNNTLRLGQIFVLKSSVNGKFTGGLMVVNRSINILQINTWFKNHHAEIIKEVTVIDPARIVLIITRR